MTKPTIAVKILYIFNKMSTLLISKLLVATLFLIGLALSDTIKITPDPPFVSNETTATDNDMTQYHLVTMVATSCTS